MKKTLTQRVLQILDEHKISQTELAAIAGCTKGLVNQWIKRADPNMEMAGSYAYKIAERLGYEPRWLILGEGPEKPLATMNYRINDLILNYARCDERGKETVLIVAEREASYNKEA
ncbi:MAG: helix-turn-helix transcriptional regulator [Fluviibacter sp.]